jgi:uncharacterized protein YlxW (UPF0749 family)
METGPHSEADPGDPSRPRRALAWRVATPVVGLLSGALFVISAHSSEGTDLRPGRFTDLASMVRYDVHRVDALHQRAADLNSQVDALRGSVDDRVVRRYDQKVDTLKAPAAQREPDGRGLAYCRSVRPSYAGAST